VNAYKWDLGDGTSMFVPGFVHMYSTAGTFSVTETVINEFGSQGSTTQNVSTTSASPASASTVLQVQDEKTQKQSVPMRLPNVH
jgi:xanthomonalisin